MHRVRPRLPRASRPRCTSAARGGCCSSKALTVRTQGLEPWTTPALTSRLTSLAFAPLRGKTASGSGSWPMGIRARANTPRRRGRTTPSLSPFGARIVANASHGLQPSQPPIAYAGLSAFCAHRACVWTPALQVMAALEYPVRVHDASGAEVGGKVVYSPHSYGPSVHDMELFAAPNCNQPGPLVPCTSCIRAVR